MSSRRSANKVNQRLLQRCNSNCSRNSVQTQSATAIGFAKENVPLQAADPKALQQAAHNKKVAGHQKRNERRKRAKAVYKEAAEASKIAAAAKAAEVALAELTAAKAAAEASELAAAKVIELAAAELAAAEAAAHQEKINAAGTNCSPATNIAINVLGTAARWVAPVAAVAMVLMKLRR